MGKTLFVGHSLVGQVMPNMFNSFMTSQGLDNEADAQVINGAPLRYNWDNGASAQGVNAREVLPSGDYDTVIVTEAIPLDTQLRYNDTQGYAERYFDLAISANADTRFYVYETWHELGASTQEWRAQIENDLPQWQGIVDHVNNNADSGAPEASIIPAGQAMANLHDRIEAGEVPGVNSIRDLFSDNIHLNDTGSWFIAALHASAVTGLDVSSLPLETFNQWGGSYGGPDAGLAEIMADVIDETLAEFLPQDAERSTGEGESFAPIEEPDDNTFDGTVWNDEIFGSAGNDQLFGNAGDDALYGGGGNDALAGGAGNDLLSGNGGDDVLTAGEGADTVSGGDGNDVFVLSGVPGSVLITDFGANGAQDMIDLSAIDGYDSFADVASATSFAGADTVLTFAVPDGVLTVTVQSEGPLNSGDFGMPAAPNGPWELVAPADLVAPVDPVTPIDPVAPVDPIDPAGLTYTIEGADSHHFTVDPASGDIENQSWFAPSYDQIWDISGDRIYEVERVGSNADGQEVSRTFFELETMPDNVLWREVGREDSDAEPAAPIAEDATFFLEGPDAYHFVIDPESGEVGNVSWFDPSYDQVWDTNGDRIYQAERYALTEDGTEISREALEMETTPNGVVWRVASPPEEEEMSGAQIMSTLVRPQSREAYLPSEPEESDEDEILLI